MGLDIYLEWEGKTEEKRQAQHTGFRPDGEAGYLRSAYNDTGFNRWCQRTFGKPGYYYIFAYDDANIDDEEKRFFPDWEAARERTLELITMADALPADNLEAIIIQYCPHAHEELTDQNVLDYYRKQAGNGGPFDCYENWAGLWFAKNPVKNNGPLGPPLLPALVIQGDGDPHGYYRQCLKETLLFIDQGQRRGGWLNWSS
jgi:hypothetical protein